MSGGVGPVSDIDLPNETEEDRQLPPKQSGGSRPPTARGGFFSFRQLNCLVIMIILTASGMVGPNDFGFVIFSAVYLLFLAKVSFPNLGPELAVFDPTNRILKTYVLFAAVIGLLLPVAYILEGVVVGDKEGIKAAAPHLFLLSSQVFMEGVAFSGQFSIPIRVFVPVFYNANRLISLVGWMWSEFEKAEGGVGSWRRLWIGRLLAVANMALWSFNLLGFLLPVYLPRAFKKYYSANKSD